MEKLIEYIKKGLQILFALCFMVMLFCVPFMDLTPSCTEYEGYPDPDYIDIGTFEDYVKEYADSHGIDEDDVDPKIYKELRQDYLDELDEIEYIKGLKEECERENYYPISRH